MAVNPLSLAESLRPWRVAGVTHFLREVLGEEDTATPHAREPQPGAPLEISVQEHSFAAAPQPAPEPLKEENDRARPNVSQDTWPEAWQVLFARTRPAPVLWTYPELGLDLGGQGDKLRSAYLRELIGKLQLPRGSSTFWPLCLASEDSGTKTEADMFKGGLLLLQPKVVVFIGPRSMPLADLNIDLRMPFTQQIFRGMLFVLLPEFAAILENASLADKASVFLRSALANKAIFLEGLCPSTPQGD